MLQESVQVPYPVVRSRRYYRFEGEDVVKSRSLPCHMTEVAGLCSYENLDKTNMAEDLEAPAHSVVETTSWMD